MHEFAQRCAIGQMRVVPGDPEGNLQRALYMLGKAKKLGAQLLVLPELCISGYLVGDLWEEKSFVEHCLQCGRELVAASQGLVLVFGNVGSEDELRGESGRTRLYNAAWLAVDGKLQFCPRSGLPFFSKSLLPNYREFEDSRHFYDLRRLALERCLSWEELHGPVEISLQEGAVLSLGIAICEDGWSMDYAQDPATHLKLQGAQLLLNLSASPYSRGKNAKRHGVFHAKSRALKVPILYANCVGSQNNGKTFFGFDGACTHYGVGSIVTAPGFAEGLLYNGEWFANTTDTCCQAERVIPGSWKEYPPSFPEGGAAFSSEDFACLQTVMQNYMQEHGLSRVVVGLSGGIDSAVAAAFFCQLLGAKNVLAVNMPGPHSSLTTRNLAQSLAKSLGCWYAQIPIIESLDLTSKQVQGLQLQRRDGLGTTEDIVLRLSDFALENIQARDRSSRLLAALSAAFGGVFSCNANKAEITVGYSTLYGDHGGFMAPLADLWKEEVYALGHYLNDQIFEREVIPTAIFNIKPSAELNASQNPEQGGGDPLVYWYHDRLFHAFMQSWKRCSPEDLLRAYIDGKLEEVLQLPCPINNIFDNAATWLSDMEKWWKLFKGMGVIKRVQAPPVVALSRRAFGYDLRESIMPPHFSREYLRLRGELLRKI